MIYTWIHTLLMFWLVAIGLILSVVTFVWEKNRLKEGDIYFSWTTVITFTCALSLLTSNLNVRETIIFSIITFFVSFFSEVFFTGGKVNELIEERRKGELSAVRLTEEIAKEIIAEYLKLSLSQLHISGIMDNAVLRKDQIVDIKKMLGGVPLTGHTKTIEDILRQAVRYPGIDSLKKINNPQYRDAVVRSRLPWLIPRA